MSEHRTNPFRGVPAILADLAAGLPSDGRADAAARLAGSLRRVSATTFLDGKAGPVACREWLAVDADVRAALVATPPEGWAGLARRLLAEGRARSRRMSDEAWDLLKAGSITAQAYKAAVAAQVAA